MLAAYGALAEGDAAPLVRLLSHDVVWIDRRRLRARRVRGRDAVADVLRRRVHRAAVRGVVVRPNSLVLSFRRLTQTVSFASEIERIECGFGRPF